MDIDQDPRLAEMMRNYVQLFATTRQAGKTYQAMAWLSHGVPVKGYPGWSRVLLVPRAQDHERIRREYWGKLEDIDHRLYTARDWIEAHAVAKDTEVCIDDLDWWFSSGTRLAEVWGRVTAATITARPWDQLEFQEIAEKPRMTR